MKKEDLIAIQDFNFGGRGMTHTGSISKPTLMLKGTVFYHNIRSNGESYWSYDIIENGKRVGSFFIWNKEQYKPYSDYLKFQSDI